MNMAMFLQILRAVLIAIGGAMTTRGWVDDATVQWVVGGIVTLAPVLWGLWVQRPAGKIEQVAALPNVKRVVTDEATAQATLTPNITSR